MIAEPIQTLSGTSVEVESLCLDASTPLELPSLLLEKLQHALLVEESVHLRQANHMLYEASQEAWPAVLAQRGFPSNWSCKMAIAAESALFFEGFKNIQSWSAGPNKQVLGNTLECGGTQPGLWLSGGTDWQGFQGCYQHISVDGVHCQWISFRVRIMTPELSCASFVAASHVRTWGLEPMVVRFNYRGDERRQGSRSFEVQTTTGQNSMTMHTLDMPHKVESGRPYHVAIRLAWHLGSLSVYVDGSSILRCMPFTTATPISYIGLFNWRSNAKAEFSEIMLGNARPYCVSAGKMQPPVPFVNSSVRRNAAAVFNSGKQLAIRASAAAGLPMWLFVFGFLALIVAFAVRSG